MPWLSFGNCYLRAGEESLILQARKSHLLLFHRTHWWQDLGQETQGHSFYSAGNRKVSSTSTCWRGDGGPNQRKEGGKHFNFNVVSLCKSPKMESILMYQTFTLQLSPANSSSLYTRPSPGSSYHLQTPCWTQCRKLLSPVNFSGCLKKSFSSLGEVEGLGTSLSPPRTA